jgi:hypothetical protein
MSKFKIGDIIVVAEHARGGDPGNPAWKVTGRVVKAPPEYQGRQMGVEPVVWAMWGDDDEPAPIIVKHARLANKV